MADSEVTGSGVSEATTELHICMRLSRIPPFTSARYLVTRTKYFSGIISSDHNLLINHICLALLNFQFGGFSNRAYAYDNAVSHHMLSNTHVNVATYLSDFDQTETRLH